MKNSDLMKLIALAVQDLEEAVNAYEAEKENTKWVRAGYEVPMHYSKESIMRRITQLRQNLWMLEIGLKDNT